MNRGGVVDGIMVNIGLSTDFVENAVDGGWSAVQEMWRPLARARDG